MIDGYYKFKNGTVLMDELASAKMSDIVSKHPEQPGKDNTGYEWSDMGLAELFKDVYGKEARYCPEHKMWYTYHNGVWKKDIGTCLISEKLKEFTRLMNLYCLEIDDAKLRASYHEFVNKMGDVRVRDRLLKDASKNMTISAVKFDANPYLINCLNGTYDLKTFEFRQPKWDDFLTMQTNFKHTIDRNVKCEIWEKFIDDVTEHDKEKADYIQRALGYSLLGMSNEECMFILYGKTTRNGKSTLLYTINTLLGDYARVAPVGLICGNNASGAETASPTLAALKGKRFVTMSESSEYGKMNEEKIKQFTGGEEITARELYQAAITYRPQFTLWLSCNDLPIVSDMSLFKSDRIKLIEFNRHFSQSEQDKHLKDKLTTQKSMQGIFMWLIRGYIRYLDRGLSVNERLQNVVIEYEEESDIVLQFLQERCEKDDTSVIRSSELYRQFKIWAKANGELIISAKKFKTEMSRHHEWFDRLSLLNGINVYRGLKMKEVI